MFIELEFPRQIAFQAQGGQCWFTTVNKGFSGFEQTNQNWALPLGKWKIAVDHKPWSFYWQIFQMWLKAAAQANAFRFYDIKDCQAENEICALVNDSPYTGDVYQLQTSYGGALSIPKPICKPITPDVLKFDGTHCAETVSISVGGSPISDWTLDPTTGLVTIASAPGSGLVTWTGQYHYPVRFDSDDWLATAEESDWLDGNGLVTLPDVVLVEKRLPLAT